MYIAVNNPSSISVFVSTLLLPSLTLTLLTDLKCTNTRKTQNELGQLGNLFR